MDESERTLDGSGTPCAQHFPDIEERIEEARRDAAPRELVDARNREDEVLQENYPGEYVAYKEVGEAAELRREVVAHDRSLKAVLAAFAHLPEHERQLVEITYCESLEESKVFRGGYDNELLPGTPYPPDD